MGIFYTWTQSNQRTSIDFPTEERQYEAILENAQYDTTARLAVLQEKISAGEGLIESAPANFRSIDQLREEAAAEAARVASEEAALLATRYATQYCGNASSGAFWNGVDYVKNSGDRIEFFARRAVGTSTASYVLFSLPIRAVRSAFDSCIDSMTIGATTAGTPLQNTVVTSYHTTPSATLIGYTRDGFGLYGPIADPETLDTCGGRYEGGSYRYHVRVGAPTLISCFAGVPEQIILEN